MVDSALKGVFREYSCTWSKETGGTTVDADGNTVPKTTPETLAITFEAITSPQLVFQPGVDPKTVRGKGACITPSALPAGLGVGSELAMTWRGRAGKLRITQVSVDPLEVLDTVLGTEFLAEWRPT